MDKRYVRPLSYVSLGIVGVYFIAGVDDTTKHPLGPPVEIPELQVGSTATSLTMTVAFAPMYLGSA
jgi:hypothetical protein